MELTTQYSIIYMENKQKQGKTKGNLHKKSDATYSLESD